MHAQPIDVFLPVGLNTTSPVPSFPQLPLVCGAGLRFCKVFPVYCSMFIGDVLVILCLGNDVANTLCGYILPLVRNTILEKVLWSSDSPILLFLLP